VIIGLAIFFCMRHRSMHRTALGLEANLPQGAMGADG
jgi:hypothetical protein